MTLLARMKSYKIDRMEIDLVDSSEIVFYFVGEDEPFLTKEYSKGCKFITELYQALGVSQ